MARQSLVLSLTVAAYLFIDVCAFLPYRMEQYVDTSVNPCEDFYNFTCGTFVKNWHAANPNQTITFENDLQERLNNITEDILANFKVSCDHPRAVNLAIEAYDACLEKEYEDDTVTTLFSEIGGWPLLEGDKWKHRTWEEVEGLCLGAFGIDSTISFTVEPDPKKSTEYIILISMPDLRLPDLNDTEALEQSITDIGRCLGNEDEKQIKKDTKMLITFMKKLEKAKVERPKDEHLKYNKIEISELQKRFSSINWLQYFRTIISKHSVDASRRITSSTKVLYYDHEYFSRLKRVMVVSGQEASVRQSLDRAVANYIGWKVARQFEVRCPEKEEEEESNGEEVTSGDKEESNDIKEMENFIDILMNLASSKEEENKNAEENLANFLENMLSSNELIPLGESTNDVEKNAADDQETKEESYTTWNSIIPETDCGDYIQSSFNFAIEYVFLQKYGFNITRVSEMITYIQRAFSTLLNRSSWIQSYTIKALLTKMRAMKLFTAFPPWLLSAKELDEYYQQLPNMTFDYMLNNIKIAKFQVYKMISRLETKPSLYRWMPEQSLREVNAYHYPQKNALVLPFSILKSPNFDNDRPMYLNFGILGSIIGHELTHAFDSSGRLFDPLGRMNATWLSGDFEKKFVSKTDCFVEQYSNFTVEGLSIDGQRTLPDNIADCGGIRQSFLAYKNWVKDNGKESPLEGFEKFTTEQLFFMAYGTAWCVSFGEDGYLQSVVYGDEHSPNPARVWGAVSNMKEFSEVFNCPKGSPMNPNHRCVLW